MVKVTIFRKVWIWFKNLGTRFDEQVVSQTKCELDTFLKKKKLPCRLIRVNENYVEICTVDSIPVGFEGFKPLTSEIKKVTYELQNYYIRKRFIRLTPVEIRVLIDDCINEFFKPGTYAYAGGSVYFRLKLRFISTFWTRLFAKKPQEYSYYELTITSYMTEKIKEYGEIYDLSQKI